MAEESSSLVLTGYILPSGCPPHSCPLSSGSWDFASQTLFATNGRRPMPAALTQSWVRRILFFSLRGNSEGQNLLLFLLYKGRTERQRGQGLCPRSHTARH